MRRVGIVAWAQTHHARARDETPAELVYPIVKQAIAASGLERRDIDYVCAASSDVLEGRPFSFGFTLDALGAVPPIEESHIEGDGAWAAYDAWLRIVAGEAQAALVVAWGKSSEGSLAHVLNTTLDPFWEAPLGTDAVALAALQARAFLDRAGATERDLAEIVARNRTSAVRNPNAQVRGGSVEEALASPIIVEPLRRAFLPPVTDGACAIVIADAAVATRLGRPIAWVAGVANAWDGGCIGQRDLAESPSARAAFAAAAGAAGWTQPDVAELCAPFPHQQLMLQDAFGLGRCPTNPSGGPLAANPLMATGLVRLAEGAAQVTGQAEGEQVPGARRALAHSTTGHCLQANMVWLLEGEPAP